MKHHIVIIIALTAFIWSGTGSSQAAIRENEKQTFHITVLNTAGDPHVGMILKISGYGTEYTSDEQGLIEFEHEIHGNNIRTANFYFPENRQKSVKSLRLDEAATDTIIRIDSQEDMVRYKQSGKTFHIRGIVKNGRKPIPNAEVAVQGTGQRTFTNENGEFSIEADYSHTIMVRADRMENKYLDVEPFLANPDEPYTIRMIRKGADRIYASVEEMPEYPGGMKAFFNYVRRKARTTELAEQTQTEGTVMIQFVVEKDGSITSPRIVRSLDAVLDTAALDAVIVMRDWIPAKDHGTVVRCKYSVPIPFKRPKPKEPEKKPETDMTMLKDSLQTDSLQTDSVRMDMPGHFAPISVRDSLPGDSVREKLTLKTDSLFADSIIVQKADTLRTDSLTQASQQAATEVKPKKRNIFVRFFRWLFGIKDKEEVPKDSSPEQTPAIKEEIPAANTEN